MFQRYNIVFFALLTSVALVLALVGYINQPLDGDLTRIGGFRENDFGWNAPQIEYQEVHYDRIADIADYNTYYDIVVLGDSFTFLDQKRSWLNFLVDKTGLKVAAFHQKKFEIKDILESKQYLRTPPQLFIYETVERGVISNILFQSRPKSHGRSTENINFPQLIGAVAANNQEKVFRNLKRPDFEVGISQAASYIIRLLKRKILHISKTEILPLEPGLQFFSSIVNNQLLISERDFEKTHITDRDIKKAALKVADLEKTVEANGQTMFLLLVLPDKLTVYRDVVSIKLEYTSVIERLNTLYPLLRIDTLLKHSVTAGVKDVYMPNDTHTSSHGNDRIAQSLVDRLRLN